MTDFLITPPSPQNQGFQQYVVGASTPGNYPTTKAAVIAAVADISGVPTPVEYFDRSITIDPTNTSIALMSARPIRNWLLIYSPVLAPAEINLSDTAEWGDIGNLIIGVGQAWFAADLLQVGACYRGAIAAIGLTPGMPLWAFES